MDGLNAGYVQTLDRAELDKSGDHIIDAPYVLKAVKPVAAGWNYNMQTVWKVPSHEIAESGRRDRVPLARQKQGRNV